MHAAFEVTQKGSLIECKQETNNTMKKTMFYLTAVCFSSMLIACGNPENRNDSETIDDPIDAPTDGVDPMDTMRRDTTDTLGQPMPTPTPPMN